MRSRPSLAPVRGESTPGATGANSLHHVTALDGLRGLAVAAVVAYHLGYLPGGFLGVDVFFVLSGYLVTSLLLAELAGTGRVDLPAFWGRRLRRLAPAVLVMVPVVLVAALAVRWPATQLRSLGTDAFASVTWWANWRQAAGTSYWAPGPSPFRHAWSLSIEEQFYLAWPLVVMASGWCAHRLGRSVRAAVGAAAGIGVLAGSTWLIVSGWRLPDGDLSRAYLGTDTRVLAPLMGCLVASAWPGHRRLRPLSRPVAAGAAAGALAGLAVAATVVHVYDPALYQWGVFPAAALLSAVLVVALVRAPTSSARHAAHPAHLTRVAALLGHPVVTYVGRRSYAIYLWSWPLQVLGTRRFPSAPRALLALGVVVTTVAIAEVSHRIVEDPIRRQRSWATRPLVRRPAWALGMLAPVLVLALVAHRSEPVPAEQRFETADSLRQASRPPPPPAPTATASGAQAARRPTSLRVMVLGDSVAFTAVYYGPRSDRLPAGISSIDGRGIIGCGVLAAAGWRYPASEGGGFVAPAGGDCERQDEAEQVGLGGRPDVVVAMAGAWEFQAAQSPEGHVVPAQSDEMRQELVAALVVRAGKAHRVGARFALVEWACPGAQTAGPRREPGYIRWINDTFDAAASTARRRGYDAEVIRPTTAVCDGADPAGEPTPAKRAATDDEVHVRNVDGAWWLWSTWLAPALTA